MKKQSHLLELYENKTQFVETLIDGNTASAHRQTSKTGALIRCTSFTTESQEHLHNKIPTLEIKNVKYNPFLFGKN